MTNDRRMSLKKMMQTLIAQMIFRLVFLWAQFGESWLSWYMVCMSLIFLAPWFFKCRLFSDGSSTKIFFLGLPNFTWNQRAQYAILSTSVSRKNANPKPSSCVLVPDLSLVQTSKRCSTVPISPLGNWDESFQLCPEVIY